MSEIQNKKKNGVLKVRDFGVSGFRSFGSFGVSEVLEFCFVFDFGTKFFSFQSEQKKNSEKTKTEKKTRKKQKPKKKTRNPKTSQNSPKLPKTSQNFPKLPKTP
jgi:hypothetical protein